MINLIKRLLKWALPTRQYRRFQERVWRYVQPLLLDYCPAVLPWFPAARSSDDIARLHRLAASFQRTQQWSPLTTMVVGVATLRWPVQFAVEAVRAFRVYSGGVEQRYGVGKWRQLKDVVKFGVGYNIPAIYYYRFRLFEQANGARAPLYIHADEMDMLYPMLMSRIGADRPLAIKNQFFENARRHGLPVAGALATFADGGVQAWYDGETGHLPPSDLVFKPVDMACGRGFERWSYDAATSTWQNENARFNSGEFVDHCCRSARGRGHILQARLRNHRDLIGLAGDGLSTIRVVTYRRPSGEQGVLLACLRMANGALQVDNFEAGGIAALIDLRTGVLGAAVTKDPRRGSFSHHPDSGVPIEGSVVPCFADAISLVLEAHRCFPWMPFVGWDVVVTDDGPLLLEANPDWCVELAQIVMDRPLGETAYPQIFLQHVAALNRAEIASLEPMGTPEPSTRI